MQQLTELPKADRVFKQIVDRKTQEYVQKAEQVADEYMKQKNQAQKNALDAFDNLQALRNQLAIIKTVQMTRVQLPGSSLSQVRELINNYAGLIENYEQKLVFGVGYKDFTSRKNEEGQKNHKIEGDAYENGSKSNIQEEQLIYSQLQMATAERPLGNTKSKKLLVIGLRLLEVLAIVGLIASMCKLLFFV